MREKLITYLGEDWTATEGLIRAALNSDISLLNELNESLLKNPGKQLRPILALLAGRACGGVNKSTRHYAAAVELLHNATLLHDDVADSGSTRRGRPTVSAIFGDTASVLVGDFWLVRAMETMLDSGSCNDRIIRMFSRTLNNLAEGEMLQLQKAEKADTTEQDYLRIIYDKTATLFETACVSAAISTGAPEEFVEAAREYAVNLGLIFQIKDDLLDYKGADIGKPIGVDLREHKITLPLLGAFLNAGPEKERELRSRLVEIEHDAGLVDDVMEFVCVNGGYEYAARRLNDFGKLAMVALDRLPSGEATTYMGQLVAYAAGRDR